MLDGILEPDHARKFLELLCIGDVRELVVEYQYRKILCLSVRDRLERVDALPRGIARAHDWTELPLLLPGLRGLEPSILRLQRGVCRRPGLKRSANL